MRKWLKWEYDRYIDVVDVPANLKNAGFLEPARL